eukprot:gnl/MRDRNA2_/MRDRNA2_76488_c0_seq2.p1 gnl/MRDRNA2_/MRDRNA2_76488_c0~~gnl/MRDRNA2_/MRDRNA2_76488_c0_seq2.p1  ORF type:complete len:617 (-),score=118.98 gnl/MRDRNA2_/MRDRNA2_76488_c0_seq2:476-2326(-)
MSHASSRICGHVLLLVLGLSFFAWAWWPVPGRTPMMLPKPCPGSSTAVYTTIEVCDLQHPQCFSNSGISNSLVWLNHDLEDRLSKNVFPKIEHVSSGRMRLRQSDALVHIEALTCMPDPEPTVSFTMASTVQQLLGGGAMRWSAMADPELQNDDLRNYFVTMGNLSEPKELIVSTQSNFSHAAIWRIGNATRLMLDGIIMSDSRDEHIYHEMLVHPALLVAERAQQLRVLIIGGGEGATLRELLRDERVQNATMVDLDERLVETCKKHLPTMHQGSFDSPKSTLVFEDGVKFVERTASASFDVIIADGIDFDDDDSLSYGNVLFSEPFYMDVLRTLRDGGVFVQYMSDLDKEDTIETLLEVGFTDAQYLCVDIPSFFGWGACFMLSVKAMDQTVSARLESAQTQLDTLAPRKGLSYLTSTRLGGCLARNVRRLKGKYATNSRGAKNSRRRGVGRSQDGQGKVQPARAPARAPAKDKEEGSAAAIGGIAGGLAVVGIIGFTRRQRKKSKVTTPKAFQEWMETQKENEKKDAEKETTLQGEMKEEEAVKLSVVENAIPVEGVDLASKTESEKTKLVDEGPNLLRQAAEGELQEKAAMHLTTEQEAISATEDPVQQPAT